MREITSANIRLNFQLSEWSKAETLCAVTVTFNGSLHLVYQIFKMTSGGKAAIGERDGEKRVEWGGEGKRHVTPDKSPHLNMLVFRLIIFNWQVTFYL